MIHYKKGRADCTPFSFPIQCIISEEKVVVFYQMTP